MYTLMENETDSLSPGRVLAAPPTLDSSGYCRSSKYLVLEYLGAGCFGRVDRCLKENTGEIVAVKTIKNRKKDSVVTREVAMLQMLRLLDPDKCNLVRFHESFQTSGGTSLVFEELDISLYDYMDHRAFKPLPLNEIRSIIQQLATALNALKSIGVIHTDLKLDNIMLVDSLTKPVQVKLIDFGLAIEAYEAKTGMKLQPRFYRSPEIMLGLPFFEAIDMWSLGCVMATMYFGMHLFPGLCEYDVMRFIVRLLGQPADHLLNAGLKTKEFFKKTGQSWRLMTRKEFTRETGTWSKDTRSYKFRSLDALKQLNGVEDDTAEAEFIDLLKEMLQMDASKRITPSQVLAHPFIAMSHSSDTRGTSTTPQHCVILVQPTSAMNSMQEDGATEQRDNHQISPQAVPNKTFSRMEIVDDSGLKLESLSETGMATAIPEATPSLNATAVAVDDSCLKLESLSESDMAAAITEATPSLNATEVRVPAVPAVDSASVDTASVLLSRAVAAAALNQTDHHLDNTESSYTTSHVVSEPKEKKKKKKKGIRRFFSRMMKALRGWCTPKDRDVE